MSEQKTVREEFKINGEQLLNKVKELVHEGNIRRVIVKQDDRTILEIPLTLGVAGILLAPTLAALGAAAALVTECTIIVEKVE
jgi:CMP-2-keto-3-deoxyoctulosonic acid synthetase